MHGLFKSGARLERRRHRAQLGVTCHCLGPGEVAVSSELGTKVSRGLPQLQKNGLIPKSPQFLTDLVTSSPPPDTASSMGLGGRVFSADTMLSTRVFTSSWGGAWG